MTTIELTAFQAGEMDQAFDIYKAELSAVVDEAFGWDEAFQRGRFFERYHPNWFEWVAVNGQRIGYVCSHQTDIEIHVSLLEKKFDYNVVKPGSIDDLRAYETSLREQIKIEAHR